MRFPYPVLALDDAGQQQWARYFASGTGGRERDVEESIWRRTQHPLNAAQSGWDGTGGRRRIVHYRNRYAVAGTHLVLTDCVLRVRRGNAQPGRHRQHHPARRRADRLPVRGFR